ncbi:MAG: rRNA pseudouridine synthase [Caldilineae bacterium]|nr:MAG: rRNA pseudouridine synthase [Caldilineae bacterium]
MRLNKYLAHAGVASRRGADALIRQGRVQVNGRTVYTMGVQIDPGRDEVTVDGRPVSMPRGEPTTLLLNKPAGYLSTRLDPQGRPTVLDLLPPEFHHLHPIGRLDLESEGLVLMSDDGDLTYRLTHPSFQHEKEYWVLVRGRVPEPALRKLRKGIELEDGMARARVRRLRSIPPEQRFWLDPEPDPNHTWLAFVITEGRKRQIRRMCQAVRLEVLRLVRIRIASLHIGDLRPGQWRPLSARQRRAVNAIKSQPPKPT